QHVVGRAIEGAARPMRKPSREVRDVEVHRGRIGGDASARKIGDGVVPKWRGMQRGSAEGGDNGCKGEQVFLHRWYCTVGGSFDRQPFTTETRAVSNGAYVNHFWF